MDVLKYFLCIFQLLLFYIFTVLLNVNSSPSDISLNSSHQAAYCIIISTQNWSCGDSCRILKVIFSEKLDEVIVASSLCTAMFWETQQRRPFQLCHERKVWGEVNSFTWKMSWWLHVVARNFKFPIFDLQMRETFTLYLHFNHEYHILYSLSSIQWKDWVWKPSLPFGSRKICSLHTTNTDSQHSHVAFAVLFTWTLIINHENTQVSPNDGDRNQVWRNAASEPDLCSKEISLCYNFSNSCTWLKLSGSAAAVQQTPVASGRCRVEIVPMADILNCFHDFSYATPACPEMSVIGSNNGDVPRKFPAIM